MGERIRERFCRWAVTYPFIGDVRGLGAMMGMELVRDRRTKEPDRELTTRVLAESLARGVILLSAGTFGNIIRLLAPLTTPDEVLDEGLDVMERALAAAAV